MDEAVIDFRAWRDSTASTFPLDDMGDEGRLLDAFNEAFRLGYQRALADVQKAAVREMLKP